MIVCSCNVISDQDIRKAILKLRSPQSGDMVSISKVYKELGKRPQCGTCLDHAIQVMINAIN